MGSDPFSVGLNSFLLLMQHCKVVDDVHCRVTDLDTIFVGAIAARTRWAWI